MIAQGLSVVAEGGWDHMDGAWWPVMMLGMVLLWALVVGVIVWLVRDAITKSKDGDTATAAPSPLDILDRRFAEGAINVDEYRQRRQALRDSSS